MWAGQELEVRSSSIDTAEGKDRVGVLRVWGEVCGQSEGWILGLDAHI